MMQKNKKFLDALAAEEDITILYACESGSRAWGFASEDSDYDVRFIYVRPWTEYFRIDERKDSITATNEEFKIDAHGWDLRKALSLIRNGNAMVNEWLQSPVYYEDPYFTYDLRATAEYHFDPLAAQYHYYGLTKNTWHKYLQGSTPVVAKKYLYAIRPVLAGLYVMRNQVVPPIRLDALFVAIGVSASPELQQAIWNVVEYKAETEGKLMEPDSVLNFFILNALNEIAPDKERKWKRKPYDEANRIALKWIYNE